VEPDIHHTGLRFEGAIAHPILPVPLHMCCMHTCRFQYNNVLHSYGERILAGPVQCAIINTQNNRSSHKAPGTIDIWVPQE